MFSQHSFRKSKNFFQKISNNYVKNDSSILKITKRFYPHAKHTSGYGFGVRTVTFPEQNPLMTPRLYRHKRGPVPEVIQYVNGLSQTMEQFPEELDQIFYFEDEHKNIIKMREDPRLEKTDLDWEKRWKKEILQCVRLSDLDIDVWGMNRVELDAPTFKNNLKKQLIVDYPVIHDVMFGRDRVLRSDWKPEKIIPGFEHLAARDPRNNLTKNIHSKQKTITIDPLEGFKSHQNYESLSKADWKSLISKHLEGALETKSNLVTVFPAPENSEIYRNTLYSNSVLAGNYLAPRALGHNEPIVTFRPEEGKLYTLVMFTPDYPFRLSSDPHNFIHWMKVNMSTPKDGEEIISYLPPIPTEYAGTFRYAFGLFEQSSQIKNISGLKHWMNSREPKDLSVERFSEDLKQMSLGSDYIPEKPTNPQSLNDRRSVSLEELQQLLGWKYIWPSGLSFFQSDYDHVVSEVCKKHNISELFYVPPDYEKMHERRAKDQRKKYIASFDWN